MKKSILFLAILLPILSYSQSYLGFNTDNYNGVHGVLFNPANIVDSKYRTDINIASVSAGLENDYISINMKDVFGGGDIDFEDDADRTLTDNNNFALNFDVLGPSFMMNLKPKHSIALYTRTRAFLNVNGINGKLYERFTDDNFDSSESFTASDDGFKNTVHGWGEIGASYATILINKQQHFLKGGITLKYLQGLGSAAMQAKDIYVDYDSSAAEVGQEIDTNGTLSYASSFEENGDFEIQSGATGMGIDLGFIYEWRPDFDNVKDTIASTKYKLKFGVAITDIGSIKYKTFRNEKYATNGINIDESFFEDNDFEDALDLLYTKTDLGSSMKVKLPTALHLNADWQIKKKLFLNLNSDLSLIPTDKENANNIVTRHSLTPRFETKWLTVQMPISTTALKNTTVGFGFRAGPLYIGSGSILSNVMSSKSKALDVYFGLKIPIYKK